MRRTSFKKLSLLFALILLVGAGCTGPSAAEISATKPATISIWQVFDSEESLLPIMNAYRAIHPNISFEYRQLRSDEYKNELLRAFAEGKGPDVFAIHNTWVGEYESLIAPLPASLQIGYSETRGTIKKETIYTLKEEPTISLRALKNDFVDVVSKDVVRAYRVNQNTEPQDRIFGLPLSVDTMALYYNKDLLNAANIPEPPTTWTQFQEQVGKLTKIGQNDTILQSGAAVGTGKNIERAIDILNLLMLQNGVEMVSDRGSAIFATGSDKENLAADAVRFYTDFANPLKQVYTWNDSQPNSFDAFVNGKAAFFLGYAYHAPLIAARSPKLNFAIAPVPQIEGGKTVNYANYWVETVSRQTKNLDTAWDFVEFAASKDQVTKYLDLAKRPPARRALVSSQLEDETLSIFASQVLTAQSWYHGRDAGAMEQAFIDLIGATLSGSDTQEILTITQNKVNQTL
ncbi:extracellular solute-binding protein [Candidatus Uhrbacteria bacterium]|nr:extracellular solute-binding protein [Candidatus Uhrbacteria bacterium]